MQCLAITTKGDRCKRTAVAGTPLCEMHARVAHDRAETATEPFPQVAQPVETEGESVLKIEDADEQPPAIETLFWALTQPALHDPVPDVLAREVALHLAGLGGTVEDMEALVREGGIAEWTVGFYRSLVAA